MKRYAPMAGGVLCALAFAGCVTVEGAQPNRLSTAEEIQMGQQLAVEVEKQETVLADPAIKAYVAEIGQRLVRNSPRQDLPYIFTVIDDPKTVNAFALPGGHMYVYSGLMVLCENEAELASVMAHEIAHVAAYHHGESLTRQMNAELLTSLILGNEPSQAAQLASALVSTSVMSRWSRDQEREADRMGVEMLFRAGYRPEAMVTFMEKMMAGEASNIPRVFTIFSSHPPTQERMAYLRQLVLQYPAAMRESNQVYAERYRQNVLQRLQVAAAP